MNNKGFTLIELLLVLMLISVISISAVVVFSKTQNSVSYENKKMLYMDIQRASKIYMDLNEAWYNDFNSNNETYIAVSELKSKNYIDTNLKNGIEKFEIPDEYLVKVYITDNGNGYVDSCVINIVKENGIEQSVCIADSNGNINPQDCCNN